MDADLLASSLSEGLESLLVDERTALFLIYYEGLSINDAAYAMDIPVSFFGMILSNAVSKMRVFTDIFSKIDSMYGSPYDAMVSNFERSKVYV